MALQHLRSSTADKRPTPGAMPDGQLAMNTNTTSPGLFLKDSNGDLIKIGPIHVGATAPNATPAAGGQAGNSKGEQWLDTSNSRYVFKIWDGAAWRTEDGEFVNTSGDTMTGALVMDNQQQVRFREATGNGTNFVAVKAPAALAADCTLTLPDATGTIVSTGDTGTITSTMILDGTIVNADINASAAIVDTKLATISTAGKVSGTAITSGNISTSGSFTSTSTVTATSLIPTSSGVPTNGVYLPAANTVGVATNSVERVKLGTTEVVFNDGGEDVDFRVEGDTNANLFKIDAGLDQVQVANLNGGPLAGMRNLLINGNPIINQRGYVSSTATSGANQYTLDRWRVVTSGQSVTFTDSANIRTVTAPAGGCEQVIEGLSILSGTYVLNWVGTATATVDGSAVSKGGSVTLTGGTNATVRFSSGTFSLAQLEPGSVSTPFERRPISAELGLCQRYYEIAPNAWCGQAVATGAYYNLGVFKVTKRSAPTMTSILQAGLGNGGFGTRTAFSSTTAGFIISGVSTGTINGAGWEDSWAASAEL